VDEKKAEEQVEDLELQSEQAEDVKGGFSWGLNQTFKPTESLDEGPEEKFGRSALPRSSQGAGNHNETLVRI
jgi:hypothetical protein